jgi:hypothetical protein
MHLEPDQEKRRKSSIVGLSRLRDLSYDAENKKMMMNTEYGAIDIVLNIVEEDTEEPRCKALGFILTLLVSSESNKTLAFNDRLLSILVQKVLKEDVCQYDGDIEENVKVLEEKWNITPTTDELQRDIRFLRYFVFRVVLSF